MYIYNAALHTMRCEPIKNGYVEIQNGKITFVGAGLPDYLCDEDINCRGGILLPGFIDAHTHLGIIGDGLGFEADDCNESSDPCTPQLRIIDALNPLDRCFTEARSRGITTVAVSPGSANAIGGEIIAVKTLGKRADDMLIGAAGIKFALGENPKTVYNEKDSSPMTRMATAAFIRESLLKAKKYAADLEESRDNPDSDPPEFDMKSEALLPLLQRKIKAHFHCHRADDIFTAIRIAKEFSLDYLLIHCTEGHLAADILGNEKACAVVGPLFCDRCKPELRNADISNAAMLSESGVSVSICTDHPETPIQYLPVSAQLAQKGGLSEEEALRAITVSPAEALGISGRVGSISVGLDADLQLYHSNPLDLLSEPEWVMIDGKILPRG